MTIFSNQAVARDPSFFEAYLPAGLTPTTILYFLGNDHTPARLALAEAAIQSAFRLRPDAGESPLARAENLYRGYLDLDGALAELVDRRRKHCRMIRECRNSPVTSFAVRASKTRRSNICSARWNLVAKLFHYRANRAELSKFASLPRNGGNVGPRTGYQTGGRRNPRKPGISGSRLESRSSTVA